MNKLEFTSILQVALFYFDNCSEKEIRKLNPQFTNSQIRTGINLTKTLQEIK